MNHIRSTLLFLTIIPVTAQAIQSYMEVSETIDGYFIADTDQRYDRYADSYFGATVNLVGPLFDEEGNYLVSPGEAWEWVWMKTETSQLVFQKTLTYIGGDAMCWSDGYCGALAGFSYGIKSPCLPEGQYSITVNHNGSPLGDGAWRPVRFNPSFYDSYISNPIKPQTYAYIQNAETSTFQFIVTDDLGCNRPLSDVEVSVNAHVKGDELAHAHMRNEVGTGTFISLGFNSILGSENKGITGKTNSYGFYRTLYKAGVLAIHEEIETKLKRGGTDIDPEIIGPTNTNTLNIEAPNLARMTTEDGHLVFGDLGGCPHDPAANWFTPSAKSRMISIAEAYYYLTGRMLSLNDSSLMYGGLIDNKGGGGREAQCHISHRRGNDIDLNHIDSGNMDVLTQPFVLNNIQTYVDGVPYKLIDLITDLAKRAEGARHPESTIHYRFPG